MKSTKGSYQGPPPKPHHKQVGPLDIHREIELWRRVQLSKGQYLSAFGSLPPSSHHTEHYLCYGETEFQDKPSNPYHWRYCLLIVLIPVKSFRSQMTFGRFFHLSTIAFDFFCRQVCFIPIVLVPADEEPDVTWSIQILLVHFAQNSPSRYHIEQADYDTSILK